MDNIIYFGIMFILSILSFILGKFIFPKISSDNIEKIETISEKWATRAVHFCKYFLGEKTGEEKMAKAVEIVKGRLSQYNVNLTDEELKAIIQYAYDVMKDGEAHLLPLISSDEEI